MKLLAQKYFYRAPSGFLSQIDFWHGLLRVKGVGPVHGGYPVGHAHVALALQRGVLCFLN
jgi:hypothetical protein